MLQSIRWILPACIGLLFMQGMRAQTTSPSLSRWQGRITDLSTQQPIAGASIEWLGTNFRTLTDSAGNFLLDAQVATRKPQIRMTAVGYQEARIFLLPSNRLTELQLVPLQKSMNEVVISATQREMRKSESPIPVETYSAKFLRRNITPTLFESLSLLNGIQPQITCNVCYTGDIRINGMEGPYTLVLVDGMPIVSQLASVYGFSAIPTNLIKRVEVVKGPAGTLYGSESMGGLINIITRDEQVHGVNADIQTTSWLEHNADLSFRVKTGKNSSLITGANVFWNDRPFDKNEDGFTDVALQKRAALFGRWNLRRTNGLPAQIMLRTVWEDRWGGDMRWRKEFRGGDSLYGENILTRRVELLGQYGFKLGRENVTADFSYTRHFQDAAYGTTPYIGTQHIAFAQLRWNKRIGKQTWSAGIPFRYFWLDDNTVVTQSKDGLRNMPFIDPHLSFFTQHEWNFTPKFALLSGIRLETSRFADPVLIPRLALSYRPAEGHLIRLSSGTGFRQVNVFTEDHASLMGARELVIEGPLQPERSWNITANYNATITAGWGYVNVDLSPWYTRFSNKILPDLSDINRIIYRNNNAGAVTQGISATVDANFRNGLKFTFGATGMDVYQRLPNETGKLERAPQLYAPNFTLSYAASYAFRRQGWTIDFTGKTIGQQFLPVAQADTAAGLLADFRPERSPVYSLLNMQVTKKMDTHTELYVSVKNLLNFRPDFPILRPGDPFDRDPTTAAGPGLANQPGFLFDPAYNYAPLQGIRLMIGCRFTL